MKTIKYLNKGKIVDLNYEVYRSIEHDITYFYIGTEKVESKKYLFFGEKIIKEVPKLAFTIYKDIEDPNYSRDFIKDLIFKEFKLLNRKEEIENGKII